MKNLSLIVRKDGMCNKLRHFLYCVGCGSQTVKFVSLVLQLYFSVIVLSLFSPQRKKRGKEQNGKRKNASIKGDTSDPSIILSVQALIKSQN